MAVYQPNAILGNSRILATFGAAGEIMTFFFPHIDYPQNLQEGMPAVYIGPRGAGQLSWTYEPCWQATQSYVPRRNILHTDLLHATAGLELRITDLVMPHTGLLVRRFQLTNISSTPQEGVLLQYLYLRLGEMGRKNSARRLDDIPAIVQYWRHLCFAMGGDPPDATQIGKADPHAPNNAKRDMGDGILTNQREDLGDVDLAFAWNYTLQSGETLDRVFLISAALNEPAALAQLTRHQAQGYQALYDAADAWWAGWLAPAAPVHLAPAFTDAYYRALLALRLLYDAQTGALLAAPEFDPLFERSGGYGFVWPRDAAEVVLALDAAGIPDMVESFFAWARTAQHPHGYWEQRYWVTGERGPGWCSFLDAIQIDQTGAMLYALGRHAEHLPAAERPAFHERYWSMLENAACYLMAALGPNGLHTQAFDLWEKFRGSFTYSNAAIAAALWTAAAWGEARGLPEQAAAWRGAADRIKAVLLATCWNGEYFARGFTERGDLDWSVDSSILGLCEPFNLLSLDNPEERAMVERLARVVQTRLAKTLPEGEAIMRHEGDDYVEGSAGGVNTLWLARVLLRLATHYAAGDPDRAADYRAQAEPYLRVVAARATGAGLLPELIGGGATPYWAAPHGWAMASFIHCALLLEGLTAHGDWHSPSPTRL